MAAPEGNINAQKFTLQEWIDKFEEVYDGAVKGLYNCLQEAWINNDIRPSTVKYLVKTHVELSTIKEDISEAIIININEKGLKGTFTPALAIWRMKMLGEIEEKDKREEGEDNKPKDNTLNINVCLNEGDKTKVTTDD